MDGLLETNRKRSLGIDESQYKIKSRDIRDSLLTSQFLLILVVQFAFGLSFSAFFLLPKFLVVQLHAGPNIIGEVTAIAGTIAVLAVPFIGPSIDRYGRRLFILIGTFLHGVSSIGFIWVDQIGPLLYSLRIFQIISFTFAFNAAATLVADISNPNALGRVLGIFGASMLVTNGIAPYILEPLADVYGWESAFILAGFASLVATCLSLFISEHNDPVKSEIAEAQRFNSFYSKQLSIMASSAAAGAAFGTLVTFYQPFAIQLGIGRIGSFFAGFTATALIARLFLGGLADRFGRLEVSIMALVLYGFSVISMIFLQSGILALLGAFFGLSHGLFYPALNALAVEGIPSTLRGRVMTYFNGAFNLGFSLSIYLFGLLAETSGYSLIFIVAGLLTHSSALLLWRTRKFNIPARKE